MISVIIPAHNEASVISRSLKSITDGALLGELEVIVVCNGCSDTTASIAHAFGAPVRVLETAVANKCHALNLGDSSAQSFPRVYADADVTITIQDIRELTRRLDSGDVAVVAPTAHPELTGCSWPVRAYYKIRSFLPSAREGIGGSGVYALSSAGRGRFGEFPPIIADDGFVRIQFGTDERETINSATSKVFPPRTLQGLIAIKTRANYGSFQLAAIYPQLWKNRGEANNRTLFRLFKRPVLWASLAAYCLITLFARRQARKHLRNSTLFWGRDNSSRNPAPNSFEAAR